jgi:hypothetical protein
MTADAPAPRYWAFISYSHADEKHARWLHRAMESFRGHRKLVGSAGRSGEAVPERIYPVFRDRDELEGAADLGERINEALASSRTLIVISSPRAAASHYVEQEIRTFKSLGREGRVLALIVDGEPNAADRPELGAAECFPAALKLRFDAAGRPTGEPAEPLAADIRPGKDEPHDALLKILAGVIGVGFDDLRQRDQHRRMRLRTIWAAVGGTAAAAFLALALLANEARIDARRQGEIARARQLAAESELARADPSRAGDALRLAVEAGDILVAQQARSFDVDAALRRSIAITAVPARPPLALPAGHEVQLLPPAPPGQLATLARQAAADGPRVVLQRWSLKDGSPAGPPHGWPGELAEVASDRFVVLKSASGRQLVDLLNANVASTLPPEGDVLAVADDGSRIALADREAVRVFEVAGAGALHPLHTLVHPRDAALGEQRWNRVYAQSASFSAKEPRLAVGYRNELYRKRYYGGVTVWQLGAGEAKVDSWISDDPVSFVRYDTEGRLHWGGGRELHASADGVDIRMPGPGADGRIAVDERGGHVAVAQAGGTLRLWDATSGAERWRRDLAARALAFVPELGLAVADGPGGVSFWPLDAGARASKAARMPKPSAESPNLLVLAAATDAGLYLTRAAKPARRQPGPSSQAVEARYDAIVQLFKAVDGEPFAPSITVNGVVDRGHFSADGRRLVFSIRNAGDRLRVCDVASGDTLAEIVLTGPKLDAVQMNASGERVVYRLSDGSVWVWAWPAAARPAGHGKAFALDDAKQRIAIATDDGVRFARLGDGSELPLRLGMQATRLAFSPDGVHLALEASAGGVWVWRVEDAARVGLVEGLPGTGALEFSRAGAALGTTTLGHHVHVPWALPALLDAARQRMRKGTAEPG